MYICSKIGMYADDVDNLSSANWTSPAAPVQLVGALETGAHVAAPVQNTINLHFAAYATSSAAIRALFHWMPSSILCIWMIESGCDFLLDGTMQLHLHVRRGLD